MTTTVPVQTHLVVTLCESAKQFLTNELKELKVAEKPSNSSDDNPANLALSRSMASFTKEKLNRVTLLLHLCEMANPDRVNLSLEDYQMLTELDSALKGVGPIP